MDTKSFLGQSFVLNVETNYKEGDKRMKKSSYSRFFAEAIPVIAFNIVFFLLTNEFTLSRWIAWACLHVAYGVYVVSLRGVESDDRKAVFGYPKAGAMFAMMLATLVAFAVVFIVNPVSEKWPVVIEVLLTAGLGVVYFSLDVAEVATRGSEEILKRHYVFIATEAQKIDEVRKSVKDLTTRKVLERAYDAIRNGNVISARGATEIESRIVMLVDRLVELARTEHSQNEMLSLSCEIETCMNSRETIIRNARLD